MTKIRQAAVHPRTRRWRSGYGRTGHGPSKNRHASMLAAGGVAAIMLIAGAVIWLTSTIGTGQARGPGGPFSLVANDGRTVTERSFPGKYLAIYFGYTSCRDVCPATLNTLSAALGRLGASARLVQPLFITVDPAHDTPAVLRRYVAHFAPGLLGLTGSAAEIAQVAREYGIVAIPRAAAVDHSSVILLFAPDGTLIAPIPADASEMVMARALARYTGQEKVGWTEPVPPNPPSSIKTRLNE